MLQAKSPSTVSSAPKKPLEENPNIPKALEEMLLQAKKDADNGKGVTRLKTPADLEAWLAND